MQRSCPFRWILHEVGFGCVEIKGRACEPARRAGAKAEAINMSRNSKKFKWPDFKPHNGG